MTSYEVVRRDVAFTSLGDMCRARLYTPDVPDGVDTPLVVLGHGMGATHEYGLEPFADRFAAAGIAALAFTYRHFGTSGGQPRQLLDIGHQLDDWKAALAYVRGLDGVDSDRIAVWGTSLGAGHVLTTAADDGKVAAVVCQCPFTDGLASLKVAQPRSVAKLLGPALRDEVARLRNRPPVLVPLVGPPGTAAMMTAPDSDSGYRALIPSDSGFEFGVAARIINRIGMYRPGRAASRVGAPTLFCLCDDDTVAPAEASLQYAKTAPRGEIKQYPIRHFDIYLGEPFEVAVADQTEFLVRHLLER
ncbi:alpha/beta hydrolase [Rhodococcus sp. 06-621-2]|nr:alpha/beta hydrolase [Rhodococcus sp. 06-621-2]OZC59797.1 alpha/beta hydrolase [Rhodococcus sp. 06-621-2]